MTATHTQGPSVTYGRAAGTVTTESNPQAGPNVDFQGSAVLDVRYAYGPGGQPSLTNSAGRSGVGILPAFPNAAYVPIVSAIPWAANAAAVAAAQTVTSGTALTLAGTQNGVFANVPLVPFGLIAKPANAVKVSLIGPGHAAGTTTAASAVVTGVRSFILRPGQWVCIPEAGGTGIPLVAQVLSVAGAATTAASGTCNLTLSVAATAAVTNAAIFALEQSGSGFVSSLPLGLTMLFDGNQGVARGVTVTSNNAGDTGWTFTVRGYDALGAAMTEIITGAANSIAYGKKAFKAIASVTPTKTGSSTGTFSIGTSDVFGFNLRSDFWQFAEIFFAGTFTSTSTGWLAADGTFPATGTTGDVRGTIQLGAVGGGTGNGATSSNGTAANIAAGTGNNLTIFITLSPNALCGADYAVYDSLYGTAQYAA